MRAVFVILVAALLTVALTTAVLSAPRRLRATTVDAFVSAHRLPPTDLAGRVARRFLVRTREYTRLGLCAGLWIGIALGLGWHQRVTLGFGPSPAGDVATMGLGGWFVGLVLSSTYWNRRTPPAGPRTAVLVVREPDRYRPRWLGRLAFVLTLVALAAVPILFGPASDATRVWLVVLAVVASALLVGTEQVQQRIARRPRTFRAPDLVAADEAVRSATSRAIGFAAAGLLVLIDGWQLTFGVRTLAPDSDPVAAAGMLIAMLIAGLVLARRARRALRPLPSATVAAPA
jgi:hypothetical protein